MTQMRTTGGAERLARLALWGLLVWLPLAFYLLVVAGDAVALGPLRGDAPTALLSFGWPTLLGSLSAVLLLALLRLVQRRFYWQIANQWVMPVVVGLGAYLLGCLVQLVLPPALWHWYAFSPQQPGWEPMYWWPFYDFGDKQALGWTLYPPLSAFQMQGYALIPPVEASCIKLGALLATLLLYRRYTQRVPQAPSASAASI